MDVAHGADSVCQVDVMLLELKARQRKRAAAERQEVQEQVPGCKSKAVKRHKKGMSDTSRSAEPRVLKRRDRCPIAQLLAACARSPLEVGGASPHNALQPAVVRQQRQKMRELMQGLKMLLCDGWVADGAKAELTTMISQASALQCVLTKPSIRVLCTSMCQPLSATEKKEQELIHASLTACCSLQENVIQFLHAREEIEEARMRANGCPWDPYGYPVCLHNPRSWVF